MSVTLKCLECSAVELVIPVRLNRKAILICKACKATGFYGDLVEAAGQRLMADLRQQLDRQQAR